MIPKVGPYNNRVNFQALIKIKKSGVENLLKDAADVSKIGSRASASASSSIAETTAFPADIASEGNALSASMRSNVEGIEREAKEISTRDLKTSESGDTFGSGEDFGDCTMGTSSLGSGMGLYSSTGATALEQSAHNPHSLYAESVHDGIEAISTPKSVETLGNIEDLTQEYLIKGFENNHGSSNSTNIASASGYHAAYGSLSNWVGSSMLREGATGIIDVEKNIPS